MACQRLSIVDVEVAGDDANWKSPDRSQAAVTAIGGPTGYASRDGRVSMAEEGAIKAEANGK